MSLLPNEREVLDREHLQNDKAVTISNPSNPEDNTVSEDPGKAHTDGAATGTAPVGKFGALQLDFQLPSSSYATMLIREFTKSRTDGQFMESLNRV